MNRAIIDSALDSLFLAGGCGATELLLIRHAEAAQDAECAGDGLSGPGQLQASRLAHDLRTSGLSAVYGATSGVASETAAAIAAASEMRAELMPELGPIYVREHALSGVPWQTSSFNTAVKMAADQFCCYPCWDSFPGLESGRLFRRQAIQAVEAIAARHSGQAVALVTHSCVINAYLSMVLDIPRDFFFAPSPASVSSVRIKGDRYGVRYINSDRPLCESRMLEAAVA
jgi:2,3-bisphosphoglycerate-dependent phosphoglycerate mutase